jgi:DNA-binding CsgD family transcriptional regulator
MKTARDDRMGDSLPRERANMDWPQRLAATAARATTQRALIRTALDQARGTFDAPVLGMLPTVCSDEDGAIYIGLRLIHVQEYLLSWRSRDPILSATLAKRAPVRETDVATRDGWNATPLCADLARRLNVASYMVAPLYGTNGDILGTLHMGRKANAKPFDKEDAARAGAFSAFLSVMLAHQPIRQPLVHRNALAPRELQVALLAAQGLSNPNIARQLGIASETVKQTLRRVYTKSEVRSRVELARRYARSGWV